jgi:hypothetical protein
MNASICKKFKCPFFSEGQRSSPDTPIGGYGCTRFSSATHCLVSQVADVTATEYELFYDKEKASPNRETMIELGIKYLVGKENPLEDDLAAVERIELMRDRLLKAKGEMR